MDLLNFSCIKKFDNRLKIDEIKNPAQLKPASATKGYIYQLFANFSGKYPGIFCHYIQYRSELSGHLFFDNRLNCPSLNYISEQICSLD